MLFTDMYSVEGFDRILLIVSFFHFVGSFVTTRFILQKPLLHMSFKARVHLKKNYFLAQNEGGRATKMYLYIIRTKAKGTGQGMTSSWVITSNHVTYPGFFVFLFSERPDDTKCSGLFMKFAFLFTFLDRRPVLEFIIKG